MLGGSSREPTPCACDTSVQGAALSIHAGANVEMSGSAVFDNTGDVWVDLYNGATIRYYSPIPVGHYLEGAVFCRAVMCSDESCTDDICNEVPCQTELQFCDYAKYEDQLLLTTQRSIDSAFPPLCQAGFYGSSTDSSHQVSRFCESICPGGHYCTEGTIQPEACPAGTSSTMGSVTLQDCKACDEGESFAKNAGSASCSWCSSGNWPTPGLDSWWTAAHRHRCKY